MLRILFAFIIALFIPAGNSRDNHNIVPEVDDLNTEQVRQIAICMLQFHKESLEKVIISLQKDPAVYAFFEHKKGKKYRIQKGQCTLGKLKIFSESIEEDIKKYQTDKPKFVYAHDQILGLALTSDVVEILHDYKIESLNDLQSFIQYCDKNLTKFTEAKASVDGLIAATIPKVITLKRAWKYFKHHLPDYFHHLSVDELKDFKPKFLTHLHDYYGFG
jgi:hypothetical protein